MRKPERRCPPYEGGEPYLYLCFAEKDSEAVFPLLEHLYLRGVRIWYSVETTANLDKLNHQQERMNNASLLVIYLTDNARHDERVKNSLLYYQHGKPVIGIDTDDGDNELAFGLTAAARHVDGRIGRNREEMEAELIRTDGFTQELIGNPPREKTWIRKATAAIMAAILLTVGVFVYGYFHGWYGKPQTDPAVHGENGTPPPSPTPARTPTPTPAPTPTPTSTLNPDTIFFPDREVTAAVRKAAGGGAITEETAAEIRTLELARLPEDLSQLEQLPNLTKLKLPQSQAPYALAAAGDKYTIVLAPEEVTAE